MLTPGINNNDLSKDFPIGTIFKCYYFALEYGYTSKKASEYFEARIVGHSEDGKFVRVQIIKSDPDNRYKKDEIYQYGLEKMKTILENQSGTVVSNIRANIGLALDPHLSVPETPETSKFEQDIRTLWESHIDSYGVDSYFIAMKRILGLSYNQSLPDSTTDNRVIAACILAFSKTPAEYGYGFGGKELAEQFRIFQKALEAKIKEQYGLVNCTIGEDLKKIYDILGQDISEYLDSVITGKGVPPSMYIKLGKNGKSFAFPLGWTTDEVVSFLKEVFKELGGIERVGGEILSRITNSLSERKDKNFICESLKNEFGEKSFAILLCSDYPLMEMPEWENMSDAMMIALQGQCVIQYTEEDHRKNYNIKAGQYKNSPMLEKLFHALPASMRSNGTILMQFFKKECNFTEMDKKWNTAEALVFIQTYGEYNNDPEKGFYAIDGFPHLYNNTEFQQGILELFPPSIERYLKDRWEIRSVPLGIRAYEDPMLQALGVSDELGDEQKRKKLVELNYKLYHSGAFFIADTYKMGFPSLQELQVNPPKAEPRPAMRGGGSMRSVRTREGGYNFQLQDESFTSIKWDTSTLQELCTPSQANTLRAENYNLQDKRWILKWETEKDSGTLIFSKSPQDPGVVSFCSGGGMEVLNMEGDSPKFALRKPVIYCYPRKKTNIKIGLELKGAELFYEYPKSTNGVWDITAFPSGNIIDNISGRKFLYIFWEATRKKAFEIDLKKTYGVRREALETFFESELSYMGLNNKEINDFIIYWVPLMQRHDYYSIEFLNQEYTDTATLNISPKPDTLIRVFMVFKGSNFLITNDVPRSKKVRRNGYTVVEWGGMDIDEGGVFH